MPMSQSSIDSIEENSNASFCMVDGETQHPNTNAETTIPFMIDAPDHPHDEPSTTDEEGELILPSTGSLSSEHSNPRIAPPSVNASDIASNVSVSSSSCCPTTTKQKKSAVIVETTDERSAFSTADEMIAPEVVVSSRTRFQAPEDDDEDVNAKPLFDSEELQPSFQHSDEVMSLLQENSFNEQFSYPDEVPSHKDKEDELDSIDFPSERRAPSTPSLLIAMCTSVALMGLCTTLTPINTKPSAPTAKQPPLNLQRVDNDDAITAQFEQFMQTMMVPVPVKEETEVVDDTVKVRENGETIIPKSTDCNETCLLEPLEVTRNAPVDGDEVMLLDDIKQASEHGSNEVESQSVESNDSDAVEQSETPTMNKDGNVEVHEEQQDKSQSSASNEAGVSEQSKTSMVKAVPSFFAKSGEWFVKALLLLLSSCVLVKFSLMATKSNKGDNLDYSKVRYPPSSNDVCAFIVGCRDQLKRTGRCRRSGDDFVHSKMEFYDCYTKDDLYHICQFLNVANLSKVSRSGKNYMIGELLHNYEDLLWGFTMVEIKSILHVHGVHPKSNANKSTLVALAVESAF